MSITSKPNNFSPNTTISSSEINDNFDTIYNNYNGGITAANLATDSVTTVKIADSNVTTAKIADDAVTAAKINWAGTGANGGIWWEEIGRTTLSGAGDTITVSGLPARKYLYVLVNLINTGGNILAGLRFNGDTATNYSYRQSVTGGADTTATSDTNVLVSAASGAFPIDISMNIINRATGEKTVWGMSTTQGTTGASNLPGRKEFAGKWANTSDAISSITLFNTSGGDYAIGSEVIVLGHD